MPHGMGYGGGMPGMPRDPRMQMPQMGGGGYGAMGLGNMYQSGPDLSGFPQGGGQGGFPGSFEPRDIGGLDYMQMGAGLATDVGNWWETRQERLGREERDMLDREERQRRRTEMGQAWRAANV